MAHSRDHMIKKLDEMLDTVSHSKLVTDIDRLLEEVSHSKIIEDMKSLPRGLPCLSTLTAAGPDCRRI